jgi:methyltransferase
VTAVVFVASVIFGLMLAEQRVSRAHERELRAAGAFEPSGDVYRIMAWLYPAAFAAMALEGVWRTSQPAMAGGPSWLASGVLLFAASKALKFWAIGTLGPRWTFRVLVLPGRPLVATGPYRYVSHPNYIAVIGELVSTAMMMKALLTGPLMLVAFGWALWARIRVEERALANGGREPRLDVGTRGTTGR